MTKKNTSLLRLKKNPLRPIVVGTIKSFSYSRRNAIRGITANAMRGELSVSQINAIRQNNSESDMIAAAIILESHGALRNRKFAGITQGAVSGPHRIELRTARLEAAYSCGIVNAWQDSSITAIDTILELSSFSRRSVDENILSLREAAHRWGASNYLARKITFFKQCFDITETQQSALDEIDKILGHDASPY